MQKEQWAFIQKMKRGYRCIGSVHCPLFPGQPIYFNRHGLNHLLRKGRVPRTYTEQQRRLAMLDQAVEIIQTAQIFHSHLIDQKENAVAEFWELRRTFTNKQGVSTIRVILRKMNGGLLHFFSIFTS